MTLWKLFDRDQTSNTLETLKFFLMSQHGKKPNYSIDKQTKQIKKGLEDIRNGFLAHTGKDKSVSSVTVPVLRHILDEACNYLNALCFPDIDSRVFPLTNSRIHTMGLDMQLGLTLLMQGANLIKADESGGE